MDERSPYLMANFWSSTPVNWDACSTIRWPISQVLQQSLKTRAEPSVGLFRKLLTFHLRRVQHHLLTNFASSSPVTWDACSTICWPISDFNSHMGRVQHPLLVNFLLLKLFPSKLRRVQRHLLANFWTSSPVTSDESSTICRPISELLRQ